MGETAGRHRVSEPLTEASWQPRLCLLSFRLHVKTENIGAVSFYEGLNFLKDPEAPISCGSGLEGGRKPLRATSASA